MHIIFNFFMHITKILAVMGFTMILLTSCMSDSETENPENTNDTIQKEQTTTWETWTSSDIVTDQDAELYLSERYQEKFGEFLWLIQFAYDMLIMEGNTTKNFLQEIPKNVSFYDDVQTLSEQYDQDVQVLDTYMIEMKDYFAKNPDAEAWDGDLEGFLASIAVIQETNAALQALPLTVADNDRYMEMGKKEYIRIIQAQFPDDTTVVAYAQKLINQIYQTYE